MSTLIADETLTAGLVVPYSPEYRAQGANRGLLDALGQMAPPISGLDHLRLPLTGTDRPAMIVIPAPGG